MKILGKNDLLNLDFIDISVVDTGVGIKPEAIGRILIPIKSV